MATNKHDQVPRSWKKPASCSLTQNTPHNAGVVLSTHCQSKDSRSSSSTMGSVSMSIAPVRILKKGDSIVRHSPVTTTNNELHKTLSAPMTIVKDGSGTGNKLAGRFSQKNNATQSKKSNITKNVSQPRAVTNGLKSNINNSSVDAKTPPQFNSLSEFPALGLSDAKNSQKDRKPKDFSMKKNTEDVKKTQVEITCQEVVVTHDLEKSPVTKETNNEKSGSKARGKIGNQMLSGGGKSNNKHTLPLIVPKEEKVMGSESNLLRMYEDGKFVIQQKGRQRIRPRRKKFTTLKKKVLEERLMKWKMANSTSGSAESCTTEMTEQNNTVLVLGFCFLEELEDEDEYNEIVDNIKDMANKVGITKRTYICKEYALANQLNNVPVFVQFNSGNDVDAASICWDGLALGGQNLECHKLTRDGLEQSVSDDEWHHWCEQQYRCHVDKSTNDSTVHEVTWHNALNDDDLEDSDCLEESVNDIRQAAEKFGIVLSCRVDGCNVVLQYKGGPLVAKTASESLNKLVIGGAKVVATTEESSNKTDSFVVVLRNLLTDDDLEDDDCLQESLADVKELASQCGTVLNVSLSKDNALTESLSERHSILLTFSEPSAIEKCISSFNSMIIGGKQVVAFAKTNGVESISSIDAATNLPGTLEVMYSGDKIIPERFAECKRVPKIPNKSLEREYATMFGDENVKPLLIEMLGELSRLQQRAAATNNTKARRRLVIGLREVARGIRSHKVKMVVMANNLDEYGVIDEKLQEILALAQEEDVPVFFELNKRNLGKALGKTIKMSVVGIQNSDGADQQFKKLTKIVNTADLAKGVARTT